MTCPACSERCTTANDPATPSRLRFALATCAGCGCLYTTTPIYLGASYSVVSPYMTTDPTADERALPFDFQTLGQGGVGRRHGFYDPKTRWVTQAG